MFGLFAEGDNGGLLKEDYILMFAPLDAMDKNLKIWPLHSVLISDLIQVPLCLNVQKNP